MAIARLPISAFLEASANSLVLDVRSPGEYQHAHLPGAVSLPLFTNEERKVVGTAYKQVSREKAIKYGLDFFGPKMRTMVEEVERLLKQKTKDQKSETVYLYCWRGGMRSGAVAWLLDLYGFRVMVLAGGYKAFRNWVLEQLEQPYPLQVLGGYTGSGKTALLQELKNKGEAIIDLEQLANHKGSAFGKVDDGKQPTQELFENRLAIELRNHLQQQSLSPGSVSASIWVEDESQRIGRVNIPNAFWKIMRQSPVYFLDIPFEQRLNYILTEYGTKSTEQLIECTQRLTKRLGGLDTKNTIAFLQEGDLREAFRILLRYYDKTYSKGLHNRENGSTLLHQVESNTVSTDNVSLLLSQYQAL